MSMAIQMAQQQLQHGSISGKNSAPTATQRRELIRTSVMAAGPNLGVRSSTSFVFYNRKR